MSNFIQNKKNYTYNTTSILHLLVVKYGMERKYDKNIAKSL